MSEEKSFAYTYTSPERRSVSSQSTESPVQEEENSAVKHGGTGRVVKAVLWGTGSCLLFGLGLSCVLEWAAYIPGIACGALGIAGMAAVPTVYKRKSN